MADFELIAVPHPDPQRESLVVNYINAYCRKHEFQTGGLTRGQMNTLRAGANLVVDGFRRLGTGEILYAVSIRRALPEECYRKGPAWGCASALNSPPFKHYWYRSPLEGWSLSEMIECVMVRNLLKESFNPQVGRYMEQGLRLVMTETEAYLPIRDALRAERIALILHPQPGVRLEESGCEWIAKRTTAYLAGVGGVIGVWPR